MKKTKLLTSVAALALVLSLGACNGGSSEDVQPEEPGDEETNLVNDVTLAFAFVDASGEKTALQDFATAYVIGSWDSWTQFIPLSENDGAYQTNFASLALGDYTYKVVLYYTGEVVSWSNCTEVTTTDQKLTITEEDEGATKAITHTLSVELAYIGPLEGEEAANAAASILKEFPEDTYLDGYWDAVHVEANDADTGISDSLYLYNDYVYSWWYEVEGLWISKDATSGLTSYTFYENSKETGWGAYYFQLTSENPEVNGYVVSDDSSPYIGLLSNKYSDPLLNGATISTSFTSDELDYSVTKTITGYEVTLEYEGATYTYVGDADAAFTGYKYDDKAGQTYEVYESSEEEATAKSKEYRSILSICIDPSDVLARASENPNYSVRYEYEELKSSGSVTYKEYNEALDALDTGDSSAYNNLGNSLQESLVTVSKWYMDINYTDDAIVVEFNEYGEDGETATLDHIDLYANAVVDGANYCYLYRSSDNGKTWSLNDTYTGRWEDNFASLGDAYNLGAGDGFEPNGQNYNYGTKLVNRTYWTLKNNDQAKTDYLRCLGGDLYFGSDANAALAENESFSDTNYYPTDNILESEFFYQPFTIYASDFVDGEPTDSTPVYLTSYPIITTVSNIGKVDLDSLGYTYPAL